MTETTERITTAPEASPSALARDAFLAGEGSPLFRAHWLRTVFIHFRVRPEELAPYVPFPLHLREGWAYVSFVAFTLEEMRLEPLPAKLCRPLLRGFSPCRFLNLRTYVQGSEGPGIYFLAEWLSSRFALPFGPRLFGLPYRAGELTYGLNPTQRVKRGHVTSAEGGTLLFSGTVEEALSTARTGSEEEFLLERYVAYTEREGTRRFFRVWHEPWPHAEFEIELSRTTLLNETGDWCHNAQFAGAHYSHGVSNVWMGRPHWLAA